MLFSGRVHQNTVKKMSSRWNIGIGGCQDKFIFSRIFVKISRRQYLFQCKSSADLSDDESDRFIITNSVRLMILMSCDK